MDESFPAIERPAPGQPNYIPIADHNQTKPLRKLLSRLMKPKVKMRSKIHHAQKEKRKFY